MFVAKAEAAKTEALIKKYLTTVKMTQKSCFLMVAEPGFGPRSCSLLLTGTTLRPQKQLLTEHSVFSKPRYIHSNAL